MINPTILQEDSPKMLQDGTGTPYLAIFSGSGAPIMDDQNGLPIGMLMTSFNYDYDEEDDDVGEFMLETDNPDLAAVPQLDYNAPLILQWGWIYPSNKAFIGPQRNVIVVGKEVTFNESGTHIRIKFANASILLKNQPSSYYDYSEGLLAAISDLADGLFIGNVSLIDYKQNGTKYELMEARVTQTADEISPSEVDPSAATDYSGNIINPVYMIPRKPSHIYENTVGFELARWNFNSQYVCDNFAEEYFPKWVKRDVASALSVTGIDTTKYKQMKRLVESMKNGPYFIDGRDNQIFIHNAQTNRPISKTYTYAGGNWELLEFSVSSEYTRSEVSIFESEEINDEGEVEQTITIADNATPTGTVNSDNAQYYTDRLKGLDMGQSFESDYNRQPGWSAQVPENYYEEAPASNNLEEDIKTQDPESYYSQKPYDSISEAQSEISSLNIKVTKEEVEEYWKDFTQRYEAAIGNLSNLDPENIAEILHNGLRFGNLTVSRKVHVSQVVNCRVFSTMGSMSAQEYEAGLLNGDYDIYSYKYYGQAVSSQATADYKGYTGHSTEGEMGMDYLQQMNNVTVEEIAPEKITTSNVTGYGSAPDFYSCDLVRISYDADVKIPIPGQRIMAQYPPSVAEDSFPGLLEDHVDHQIEAKAIVVGDPTMESSMNLLIQNVSKLYSGIWYIKKISHRMSASIGYKCDIEFVLRTSDLIVSTTTTKNSLVEAYKAIQKKLQEAEYDYDDAWGTALTVIKEDVDIQESLQNGGQVAVDATSTWNEVVVTTLDDTPVSTNFANDASGNTQYNSFDDNFLWNSEGAQNQQNQ